MSSGNVRWVFLAVAVLLVFILSVVVGAGAVALYRSSVFRPDAVSIAGPEPIANENPPASGAPGTESAAGGKPSTASAMSFLPAGSFTMGATQAEVDWQLELCDFFVLEGGGDLGCQLEDFTDQLPSHIVTLDGFYLDQYEVTNEEYLSCVEAGVCQPPDPDSIAEYLDPLYFTAATWRAYPVVGVSHGEAADYCAWVDKRLPTEAEWERAARGDDQRLFSWGNPSFDLQESIELLRGTRWTNYCDSDCLLPVESFPWVDSENSDGFGGTAPVGSYPPGPYDIYDLSGNVQEWVQDHWSADYFQNSPSENPVNLEGGPGAPFVTRGGGWNSGFWFSAATHRWAVQADRTRAFLGFRCAMDE